MFDKHAFRPILTVLFKEICFFAKQTPNKFPKNSKNFEKIF
jgi:hypothetical protein